MKRWLTKPFLEVANLTRGTEPGSESYIDSTAGVRFLRVGDITGKTDNPVYTNATQLVLVTEDDLLLALDGTPGHVSTGHCGAICSGIRKVDVLDKRNLSPGWLRYALKAPDVQATIKQHARGVTILHASSAVPHIKIPLPPLAEQERIVKLLDEADELRKLRAQADRRTADLISALFHEMFGDPVKKTSRLPILPLGEVVDFGSGATPSKENPEFWNGRTPWVSPKDMKAEEITDAEDHVSAAAFEKSNLQLIPKDTVLIVVRGMILAHTVPIRLCRVPVAINQDMKALLPKQPIEPEFLRWSLQAQHPHLLNQVSTAGHGTKKLDSDRLRAVTIPIPPLPLQKEFAARVSEIRAAQSEQSASRRRLENLFQSMLHRAFKGEL